MHNDEKLQCFYLTEWVWLIQTAERARFNFSQRNYIVYAHLLSCEGTKKLSIMRWQLIACLQRYSDFADLWLRIQRYRIECCAEKTTPSVAVAFSVLSPKVLGHG